MTMLLHAQTKPEGGQAMTLVELRQHIRALITLGATKAPVISCYLNLEANASVASGSGGHVVFAKRAALLRKSTSGENRKCVDEALQRIDGFIAGEMKPETKGVAVFARGGAQPFFLALQLQVPLPNWIVADVVPNVYHLIELKDTYHRFVLLLMTDKSARILEINLGALTQEVWAERPELRDFVASGWSKAHYRNYSAQQTGRFVGDAIEVLDRLVSAGGHTHLILAGNPALTTRMKQALPTHLADKLVDTVHASARDSMLDIVTATNSLFVEQEEMESQTRVCVLVSEIKTHGLAVAGTESSLRALRSGLTEVLVMAKDYQPDPGWRCAQCGRLVAASRKPVACPDCVGNQLREVATKEEMVRLAERNGAEIEIVAHSDVLMHLGGVGCLLRYPPSEEAYRHAD